MMAGLNRCGYGLVEIPLTVPRRRDAILPGRSLPSGLPQPAGDVHLDVEVLLWCDGLVVRGAPPPTLPHAESDHPLRRDSFWPITSTASTSSSAVTGAQRREPVREYHAARGQLAVPEVRNRQRLRQRRRSRLPPCARDDRPLPHDHVDVVVAGGDGKPAAHPSRRAIRPASNPPGKYRRPDTLRGRWRLPDRRLPIRPTPDAPPAALTGARPGRGRRPIRESAWRVNHEGERNERALLRLQEIVGPATWTKSAGTLAAGWPWPRPPGRGSPAPPAAAPRPAYPAVGRDPSGALIGARDTDHAQREHP